MYHIDHQYDGYTIKNRLTHECAMVPFGRLAKREETIIIKFGIKKSRKINFWNNKEINIQEVFYISFVKKT